MKWTLFALMIGASILPAATLASSSQHGNRIDLQLSDGTARIEWLSESSCRFSRRWGGLTPRTAASGQAVQLKISDNPDSLTIATKYLLLTISKQAVLVRVAEPDGTPIMADASEAE